MPESRVRTALYRLYDADDRLLYTGISGKPKVRLRQHAGSKSWWPDVTRHEIEWHADRALAAEAEVETIIAERPLHNVGRALDKHGRYLAVAHSLRSAIRGGDLLPGHQLPSENTLADRFDTTRATVRKGVALLRAEGLITSRQGKGAFVNDAVPRTEPVPVADPQAAAQTLALHMSRDDLVLLAQAVIAEIAKK